MRSGETLLTDGPYADVAERFGGFWIVEVPDLDTALKHAQDCPAVARMDGDELVLLADQDRGRWRWPDIDLGLDPVTEALRRSGGEPGPWTLQAAIAAIQVQPSPDHDAVVGLYDRLAERSPSAAVFTNRAAAVALAQGPAAGIAAAAGVDAAPGDHRLLVLRAQLHADLGRMSDARSLLVGALGLTRNDVERRHLQRLLDRWDREPPDG